MTRPLKESVEMVILLTPIDSYCVTCKDDQRTFSPVSAQGMGEVMRKYEMCQSWALRYECAKCKQPLDFLIARSGNTYTLTGRSPIMFRVAEKELPADVRANVSKGIIATETGFVLAGIFYLRVAVEQFFRKQPAVVELLKDVKKPTGDELGAAYNSSIPEALRGPYPSLKDVYSKLSEAMHAADENRELFEKCLKDVVKHFKARKLLEIDPE